MEDEIIIGAEENDDHGGGDGPAPDEGIDGVAQGRQERPQVKEGENPVEHALPP